MQECKHLPCVFLNKGAKLTVSMQLHANSQLSTLVKKGTQKTITLTRDYSSKEKETVLSGHLAAYSNIENHLLNVCKVNHIQLPQNQLLKLWNMCQNTLLEKHMELSALLLASSSLLLQQAGNNVLRSSPWWRVRPLFI